MPARCYIHPARVGETEHRALRGLASVLDVDRVILAGWGEDGGLLVAEPGAGFVHVGVDPEADAERRPAILDRIARRVALLFAEVPALAANARPFGATAIDIGDGPGALSWDDLRDPERFDAVYGPAADGIPAPSPDRTLQARVAEEIARREGLAAFEPEAEPEPAPGRASAPGPVREAPAQAAPAAGSAVQETKAAPAAAPAPAAPAVQNRLVRAAEARKAAGLRDADKLRIEREERDERIAQALSPYGLFLAEQVLLVPPEHLEGADALRARLQADLFALDESALDDLCKGTVKRLREGHRSDADRVAVLDAISMLRTVGRSRGLTLSLPLGPAESRTLNARIAVAAACAHHFYDSELACERVLQLFAEYGENVADVVEDIQSNPRRFGRPRSPPGRARSRRVTEVPPDRRVREKRKHLPEWLPLPDAAGKIRIALERYLQAGAAGLPNAVTQ